MGAKLVRKCYPLGSGMGEFHEKCIMHQQLFVAPASTQVGPNTRTGDIASQNGVIRTKAYLSIVAERRELIQGLEVIVNQSADTSYGGSTHTAIMLLGHMRAGESAKVLRDNLMFQLSEHEPFGKKMIKQDFYPCADSLVKIGSPSIGQMTDLIRSSKKVEERNLAAWVIMEIEGAKQATYRLQRLANIVAREDKPNYLGVINYIKN